MLLETFLTGLVAGRSPAWPESPPTVATKIHMAPAKMPQRLQKTTTETSKLHPDLNISCNNFESSRAAHGWKLRDISNGWCPSLMHGHRGSPAPWGPSGEAGGCCHLWWLRPLCPSVETGWIHSRSNNLQSVCQARSIKDKSLITGKMIITEASGEICSAEWQILFLFFFLFHLKSLNEPSC